MIYDYSPYQKSIMKLPHYEGIFEQWQPIFRPMPQLNALHINSQRGTWKTCTHCFGNREEFANHYGMLERLKCTICGGSGQIYVNQEGG